MIRLALARSLAEEITSAATLYEAADPDAPAWEAVLRARRARILLDTLLASSPAVEDAHESDDPPPAGDRSRFADRSGRRQVPSMGR